MRRILLDTHIFLWMQFESEKLSDKLIGLLKSGNVNWYLSQVSVLEIQIKHSLGKLPNLHRDPFDRLLISTALTEGWEVATVDHQVRQYPVRAVS